MTPADIASLLVPYVKHSEESPVLSETLLSQLACYLELVLRWNARTNLTAVREAQEIVSRHFGESLFAARWIFPAGKAGGADAVRSLADVGSGAGFPGLPIKLWVPQLSVTLVESLQKKATFLREVIRALDLVSIEVRAVRAETVLERFDVVTLRAVERFEEVVIEAAALVRPGGRVALLIGEDQVAVAGALLPGVKWEEPLKIPESLRRVLLVGVVGEESR